MKFQHSIKALVYFIEQLGTNMTQVNKNDVNQIFASNAPDQDKPPSFANYTTGWGTSRSNNGKPTIKGFNFLQQRTDQNFLWIHQNGGALPYDSSIDYVDGSIVLKDGKLQQINDGAWSSYGSSDSDITTWTGNSQADENKKFVTTVSSYGELDNLKTWDGRTAQTKGFHNPTNLALSQPYKGGATYIYLSNNASINDGHAIFNGWTLIPERELNVLQVGAVGDFDYNSKTGTDDSSAMLYAVNYARNSSYTRGVYIPSGTYLFSDELALTGTPYDNDSLFASREWGQNTVGCYIRGDGNLASRTVFKPSSKDSVGFSIRGGSGTGSLRHIAGISILPFAGFRSVDEVAERDGIGLLIQDACFSHIADVYVGSFNVGIRLNNYQKDGFCEFNRFTQIRVETSDINIDYLVSKDNTTTTTDSFHGNSWTATQNQVRPKGGIGLRVTNENPNGARAHAYNGKFDINFFGGTGCIAVLLENGYIRSASGDITGEGDLEFVSKDTNSWLDSVGSYRSIGNTTWTAPDFSTQARIDTNFAFRFSNVAKPDVNFSGNNTDLANTDALKPISIIPEYSDRPFIGQHQDSGLMFVNRQDDVWGWGFGKFGDYYGNPKNVKLSYRFADGGDFIAYSDNLTLKNNTYGLQFSVGLKGFFPQQGNTISLGVGPLPFSAVWTTAWEISNAGILPNKTATYNIGSSGSTVNNIYTQNAVTVVSDRNAKNSIQSIDDKVLDAWSEVEQKQYKLNGDDNWSFGYIAQDIVDAFTRHGLDYKQYNIVHEEDGKFMLKYDMCAVLESALNRRKQK